MEPLKVVVKVETDDAEKVKEDADEAAKVAQRSAATLAQCLFLPLQSIDAWSYQQKHTWLKSMLTRHLSAQTLDESETAALMSKLEDTDAAMRSDPGLSLDSLMDVVETKLGCQTADNLRSELRVWRLAARNPALHGGRFHSELNRRQSVASTPSPRPSSKGSISSGGGNCDLLWQHILRLLLTQDPSVRWLHPQQGRFQFVRSSAAAKSWGRTKNNANMSFEKMSRSIRQYYRQRCGVIQKVPNKARLQYQFNMRHPDVIQFIVDNFPGCVQSACGCDPAKRS